VLRYSQAKTQRHATKCRQGHIGIPFLVGLITKVYWSNSPWMRGAPHSGFSALIRRISARRSAAICGRPPRERDFQRLSFPKIISAHSDGAVRKELAW
jgi:hypothetical protein